MKKNKKKKPEGNNWASIFIPEHGACAGVREAGVRAGK